MLRPPADPPLDPGAIALLDCLPADLRLGQTRQRYPHVINRLAAVWTDQYLLELALRALLHDDRGNRQGFPADVAGELADLRLYVLTRPQAVGARRWPA